MDPIAEFAEQRLERLRAEAVAAERRACAEVVERWAGEVERERSEVTPRMLRLLAAAIRKRDHTPQPPGRGSPPMVSVQHFGRVQKKSLDDGD